MLSGHHQQYQQEDTTHRCGKSRLGYQAQDKARAVPLGRQCGRDDTAEFLQYSLSSRNGVVGRIAKSKYHILESMLYFVKPKFHYHSQ